MSGPSQESGPSYFLVGYILCLAEVVYIREMCDFVQILLLTVSFGESQIFMWLSSPFLKWYEKGNEYN